MLNDIKKKASGIAGSIIVVLLAIIVCLGGVQFYSKYNDNQKAILSVDGININESSVNRIVERHKYILSKISPGVSITEKEMKEIRKNAIDSLVDQKIAQAYIKSNSMYVPSDLRDAYVRSIPDYQTGNSFDETKYKASILQNYGSESNFLEKVNDDLLVMQIKNGIAETVFLLPYELSDLTYLSNQVRDVRYIVLDKKHITPDPITKKDIENYYNDNKHDFASEEKVKVSYVVLSKKKIASKLQPTQSELKEFFAANSYLYHGTEQVKIETYSVSDYANGNEKSASLLKEFLPEGSPVLEAIKNGAEVDSSVSKDWVNLGNLEQEVRDKIKSLEAGGFAVIAKPDSSTVVRLLARRDVKPSFKDVQKLVTADWKNEKVEKKYAELLDEVSDLAYTSDNLKPIAEKLDQPIMKSDYFSRDKGSDSISSHAIVRTQAFSEDVLNDNLNSSLVKISDSEAVVIHLIETLPAKQQTLKESIPAIKEKLEDKMKSESIKGVASGLVKDLEDGKSISEFTERNSVKWQQLDNIKREGIMNRIAMQIKDEVFSMPRPIGKQYSYKAIKLEGGEYVLVQLVDVRIAKPLLTFPSAVYEKYMSDFKNDQYESFQKILKEKAKIKKYTSEDY